MSFSYAYTLPPDNHHGSQKLTDEGTTLPTIGGPFGTRGGGHRFSLNRVENQGRLTLWQETVVLGFSGCVVFPTNFETAA